MGLRNGVGTRAAEGEKLAEPETRVMEELFSKNSYDDAGGRGGDAARFPATGGGVTWKPTDGHACQGEAEGGAAL